jgi:anti-sigma factor RsiW
MRALTCAAARRKLQAFHDGELSVPDQIAVGSHLEWCDECATSVAEIEKVGTVLREMVPARRPMFNEEVGGFAAAVVNRAKAERDQSLLVRVRDMFEDMHLVYAGLGATVATVMCVVIMLGMMRFATRERPDSLAAIVNILANPGSNLNPVSIDARMQAPRALDPSFSEQSAQEDAVFALAAVVTREGTIANLEMLRSSGRQGRAEAQAIEHLMDAMSRARFEPAQVAGLPVAVNMVWLVAHTTVRAKHPIA